MATFATIAARVQALCNDQEAVVLTSTFLLPYVNTASEELAQRLRSAGADRMRFAATLDIPAGTTSITSSSTPAFPTGFIEPDALYEKDDGAATSTFVRMTGPIHLPDVAQSTRLNYWNWVGGSITFVGATTARDVRVEYFGDTVTFTDPTDTVEILGSVNALAHLTAAAVMLARDVPTSEALGRKADFFVEHLINEQIKARQATPVRRMPSRANARYYRNRFF